MWGGVKPFKKQQVTKLALATSIIALSSTSYAADNFSINENNELVLSGDFTQYFSKDDGLAYIFNGIKADITPTIRWNQYALQLKSGSLTITGDTDFKSISQNIIYEADRGTYAFHSENSGTKIALQGNIDAISVHNLPENEQLTALGANMFYARFGGTIELGNTNTTTTAWVIAGQPDLITAKDGGKVVINSTDNRLVGSIDFVGGDYGTNPTYGGGEVKAVFSGENAYWYGDDHSVQNLIISVSDQAASDMNLTQREFWGKQEIDELFDTVKDSKYNNKIKGKSNDVLDLTFENGAQYTYFGITDQETEDLCENGNEYNILGENIAKRVSSITLRNGGIINLFDENIEQTWKSISFGGTSLWDTMLGAKSVKHDYIRLGDLNGSGGIFRLDLDGYDKSNSDMVFIETSSTGGTHYIEPYNMDRLVPITPTNTLTFALTAKAANNVTFADKVNIEGETLYDYEMEIGSREITGGNIENPEFITYDGFDPNDFDGGTEWFIKRFTIYQSAATLGMKAAGYASYDAAISMDRHDRRLKESVFVDPNSNQGLWVRMQYGERGIDNTYSADITTATVGYEHEISENHRLGVSVSYSKADTELLDVRGDGEYERYEASVYDTFLFGNHYLDLVARFGQIDNDFNSSNNSGTRSISASFDQEYAAVSAEYGYNYTGALGFFIEPQVQLQAAYLSGYNYSTQRNMHVDADSTASVIGRAGARFGKEFKVNKTLGQIYLRADLLHQFTDGQDATFSDLNNSLNVTWGDTDTWGNFGIGGYLNISNAFSLQLDVETAVGDDLDDTWLVSGRAQYLF